MKSLDKDGNEDARGFYLQAWSGKDAYTFDRIGRGLDLRVDVCCVSLLGTTQPAVISSYLSDAVVTGGGDGLVARFGMLVWPDVKADWRNVDRLPDTPAAETAMEVFQRLDQMDGTSLRFDETAQVVFDEWRVDLEKRLRSGDEHPALEGLLRNTGNFFRHWLPLWSLQRARTPA